MFSEISPNSQENTCARVRLRPAALLKKRFWHRYFPANFAKFLRTPFFTEQLRWLLLKHSSKQPEVFYKRAVLRNFAIFTQKSLWWSLFLIKLQVSRPDIKTRLQDRCFPVDIAKFLRSPILKNCKLLRLCVFQEQPEPSIDASETYLF